MKYVVTTKMKFLVEADSASEAVEKAIDANLSRATIKNGVRWQSTERLHVATEAFAKLEHRVIMADKPPVKWIKVK